MKNRHNRTDNYDYYDEDEDYMRKAKKKDSPRRRETKNWKRAWHEHETDYDEVDDFHRHR